MECYSNQISSRFKRNNEEIYNNSAKVTCIVPLYVVHHQLWSLEKWKNNVVKLKKEIESICDITDKQLKDFMDNYYKRYVHENIEVKYLEVVDEEQILGFDGRN